MEVGHFPVNTVMNILHNLEFENVVMVSVVNIM